LKFIFLSITVPQAQRFIYVTFYQKGGGGYEQRRSG
jgi:hypothetical protein